MKRIDIEGMTARDCPAIVEEVLSRLENAEAVKVYAEESYAEFIGSVNDDKIISALMSAGYTVKSIEVQ